MEGSQRSSHLSLSLSHTNKDSGGGVRSTRDDANDDDDDDDVDRIESRVSLFFVFFLLAPSLRSVLSLRPPVLSLFSSRCIAASVVARTRSFDVRKDGTHERIAGKDALSSGRAGARDSRSGLLVVDEERVSVGRALYFGRMGIS